MRLRDFWAHRFPLKTTPHRTVARVGGVFEEPRRPLLMRLSYFRTDSTIRAGGHQISGDTTHKSKRIGVRRRDFEIIINNCWIDWEGCCCKLSLDSSHRRPCLPASPCGFPLDGCVRTLLLPD
jgi:hypothetical protein